MTFLGIKTNCILFLIHRSTGRNNFIAIKCPSIIKRYRYSCRLLEPVAQCDPAWHGWKKNNESDDQTMKIRTFPDPCERDAASLVCNILGTMTFWCAVFLTPTVPWRAHLWRHSHVPAHDIAVLLLELRWHDEPRTVPLKLWSSYDFPPKIQLP